MGKIEQLTLPLPPEECPDLTLPQMGTLLALRLGTPVRVAGVWYPEGMWDTPLPRSTLRVLRRLGLVMWEEQGNAPPMLTENGRRYARKIERDVNDLRAFVRTHMRRAGRMPTRKREQVLR